MANFVSALKRVVSTDGTLTSADTQVGDILHNEFTGALSLRAQDPAGAAVEVPIPAIGGGSGTANRLCRFTTSTSFDDSSVSDNGNTCQIGQAGQWRLSCGYATGLGWTFLDNANNIVAEITGTGKATFASDLAVTNGVCLLPGIAPVAQTVLTITPVSGLVAVASDATTTPYTPGNPANWVGPAPTNVEDALDRLASYLNAVGGGAVP